MAGSEKDRDGVFEFFRRVEETLNATERYLSDKRLDSDSADLRKAAHTTLHAIHDEMTQAEAILAEDADARRGAADMLKLAGSVEMLTAQSAVTEASKTPEATAASLGAAFDWTKTGIDKVLEFLPDNPLKKLLKDVSILLPQIKTLVAKTADKVDALTRDVAEMEAKIERFLHQVTGNPLVKDETRKGAGKIPQVEDPVPEPKLKNSLLWFLWDIERKLEHLWERVEGGGYPRPNPDELILDPDDDPQDRGQPIGEEIDELQEKIDCLIKFLGITLYNVEWDCSGSIPPDPPAPPEGELHPLRPDGRRHPRATPPESIKDELHEIEKCLEEIKECLDFLKQPDVPPEEPPEEPVFFADFKRIVVYEEDVFTPSGAGESRLIEVRSAAFDLAGWVDLSAMSDGDEVVIALYVNLPGGVRRQYRITTYRNRAEAALYALQDAIGPVIVVGNSVDIEISLAASSGTAVDIPYQFVVETQRLAT